MLKICDVSDTNGGHLNIGERIVRFQFLDECGIKHKFWIFVFLL